MTIKLSGPLSVHELNIEVGRDADAPFSMDDTVMRVLAGVPSGPYSWDNYYGKSYEIVAYVTSNVTGLVLKDYFLPAVWADDNIPKRVVINSGVTISGLNQQYALIPTDTAGGQAGSWAGSLILENRGTISGIGGTANSGVGGNAIWMNFTGRTGQLLLINNYGTIRSGGGGGGRGGDGGQGYWTQLVQVNNSGELYTSTGASTYKVFYNAHAQANNTQWWWGSSQVSPFYIAPTGSGNIATLSSGGWIYYRGSNRYASGVNYYYGIGRYQEQLNYHYTSGGTGGVGGRGIGSDGANAVGSAGAAGGTNAGAGATGGTGGGWGSQGNTGGTGVGGNYTGGLAGATGGAAGFYINGLNKVILNNTGTVQGRTGNL